MTLHKIIFVLCLLLCKLVYAQPASNTITDLPGEVAFIEKDDTRNQFYVSIPDTNQVLFISADTLQITNTINFTGNPYGLDLSSDGNTLYVGLTGTGTVALVELNNSLAYTEVNVASKLAHMEGETITDVYDVLEVGSNKVFVSSSGGAGFSNIVYIHLGDDHSVHKAGLKDESFPIIWSNPIFTASPDQNFVYAYETTVSPGSLYKLDANKSNAPVVAEDPHGEISSYGKPKTIFPSPDGKQLILGNRQIINEATLTEILELPISNAQVNSNNTLFYGVENGFSEIGTTTIGTQPVQIGQISNPCGVTIYSRISLIYPDIDDKGIFVLYDQSYLEDGDNKLCYLIPDDTDSDGKHDLADNCKSTPNPDQLNTDNDQFGNICDDDDDDDGLLDVDDPYPLKTDGDGDGTIDSEDNFPTSFAASIDSDGDGKPNEFNPDCDLACQQSSGLTVDNDDDNDGITDNLDPLPLVPDQGDNPQPPLNLTTVDLPGTPAFVEHDFERSLAYISIPEANQVLFVSLSTLEILYVMAFEGKPQGLDLSDDGNTLYVGLSETGSVALVELDNALSHTEVNVASALGYSQVVTDVYDVLEVGGNKVFVSSDEYSNIVYIDLIDGHSVHKAGYNDYGYYQTVRYMPLLAASPDQRFVYVYTTQLNPGSLYKLDASQANAPIIAEDDHDVGVDFSGTPTPYSVSDNGNYILLGNGEVRSNEATFVYDAFSSGYSRGPNSLSQNKQVFHAIDASSHALVGLDTSGFYKTALANNVCNIEAFRSYAISINQAPLNKGWYVTFKDGYLSDNDEGDVFCFQPNSHTFTDDLPKVGASLNPGDYFPLTDNLSWDYIINSDSYNGLNNYVKPGTVLINGKQTKAIQISTGETEYYTLESEGVMMHRSKDNELDVFFSPPLPMTPDHLALGTTVTQSGTAISKSPGEPTLTLDLEVTTTVDNYEVVHLPNSRNIEAFKMKQVQTYFFGGSQIGQLTQYYWFAKNIGLIKTEFEGDDGTYISELVSTNDLDVDTIPDDQDLDIDGDGVPNVEDDFPRDPTESNDSDQDGVGDNADPDDDNDGVEDYLDNCQFVPNVDQKDANFDGEGDACDSDDTDGDDVPDNVDAFPLDPSETSDNDNDGLGDNADQDDDNDTILDIDDNCPLEANLDQSDVNDDGIGDVCDPKFGDCTFFIIKAASGSLVPICL